MWINLTEDQALVAANVLRSTGFGAISDEIHRQIEDRKHPDNAALIDRARADYALGSEGDVDVDADAVVSKSDSGAYVMAWVWVPAADAEFDEDPANEGGQTFAADEGLAA